MGVRQASKDELVAAIRARYWAADRKGKGRILDDFVATTGYGRKWAIELLRTGPPPPRAGHVNNDVEFPKITEMKFPTLVPGL